MTTEDWEKEFDKDIMYVKEDVYEFYQSLTDNKVITPPATIIVKHKKIKPKNHEHKVNSVSL